MYLQVTYPIEKVFPYSLPLIESYEQTCSSRNWHFILKETRSPINIRQIKESNENLKRSKNIDNLFFVQKVLYVVTCFAGDCASKNHLIARTTFESKATVHQYGTRKPYQTTFSEIMLKIIT